MFAKMINMARTPDEVRKEVDSYSATPKPSMAVASYPYGLCISLEDDQLKKLGLDGDLPDVGEVMQFAATARVTSARQEERETADGKKEPCRRIELQITDMAVPAVDEAEASVQRSERRRANFYGKPPSSDAE